MIVISRDLVAVPIRADFGISRLANPSFGAAFPARRGRNRQPTIVRQRVADRRRIWLVVGWPLAD